MARRLARLLLTLALLASAVVTARAGWAVWQDPTLRPLRDASIAEIAAATDRILAREATAGRLAERLNQRLAEAPRNWIAIDALTDLALARGTDLPADLTDRLEAARRADFSLSAQAADCAACLWDIAACSLSTALVCKAPVLMTPVEDLRGIVKAGADLAMGKEIDQLDLGLSVVGLGATALVVATGGSSFTLKAGTAALRLARGMGRISPELAALVRRSLSQGVDWAGLPAVRGLDDLPALLRGDALAPLTGILTDLGRVTEHLGAGPALHLLPLVDDASDARALARAAEALGPRTVGAAEVLGKSRLFGATARLSRVAVDLTLGLASLLVGLGALLASTLQTALLRATRRRLV